MFECLECGRKFRSVRAAERAANNGCPQCGGVDIGEAEYVPRKRAPKKPKSGLRRFGGGRVISVAEEMQIAPPPDWPEIPF